MTAPYLVTEREHLEDLQAAAPAMLALLRLTERFSPALPGGEGAAQCHGFLRPGALRRDAAVRSGR